MDPLPELDEFFHAHGMSLLNLRVIERDNFERFPAPGSGRLRALTARVLCHEPDVFGGPDGDDYLRGVHPRMATLTDRLASYLGGGEVEVAGPLAETAVAIRPYPDPQGAPGHRALPLSTRRSWGSRTIPPDQLARSSYYAGLIQRYGPLVGVVTNNGTVVGPDGGLLAAVSAVAKIWPHRLRVLELGAGGGATALALCRHGMLASYFGNDFSNEMINYLQQEVVPELTRHGVDVELQAGSCFEAPLPAADLVCIGVYYQAQPDLLARRGAELARSIGDSGVVVVQSGMLEDPFVTSLLAGSPDEHAQWPWFSDRMQLRTYFQYIIQTILEQEIIVVATNSRSAYLALSRVVEAAAGGHHAIGRPWE